MCRIASIALIALSVGAPASAKKWDVAPDGAPEPGTRESPWAWVVVLHTGDVLPVFGDEIPPGAFAEALRCRATGHAAPIAEPLGRILLRAAKRFDATIIEIIAGYRSDKFNEQLRKKGREVAAESYHRFGRAIDWRLRNVPHRRLLAYLRRIHDGGLGRYPVSDFVHIDTGPKREWRGR